MPDIIGEKASVWPERTQVQAPADRLLALRETSPGIFENIHFVPETIADFISEDLDEAVAAAEAARDQAQGYAVGASVQHWYLTEAAMQAALGSWVNGDTVGVLADETAGGQVTFYMKSGGVWVGPYPLSSGQRVLYLDPATGSDSNSGLSQNAAFATHTAAIAAMAVGDRLLIHASARIHGALAGMPDFTSFDRYGYGDGPFFDQSRPIPANAWVADGDLWYADVTHVQTTSNPGAGDANSCWFQMWSEWDDHIPPECLQPYWAGADIAANKTYIEANPGVFTCHKQGSTQKNPQADGAATAYRYYVYPPNGEDPSAGEITYYYAEQLQIAALDDGCSARNMTWQRTATKDAAGHNTHYCDTLENINIIDAPIHGWVGAAINARNVKAKCSPIRGSHTGGGGGIHIFGAAAAGARLENCEADGFGSNYFTHSPGGGADSNNKVTIRNCVSRNGGTAIAYDGSFTFGADIDGFKSINDGNFVTLPQYSTLKNASFLSKEGNYAAAGITYYGEDGGTIELDNVLLIFRGTGARVLAQNQQASSLADSGHSCTLTFRNCTNIGGVFTGSVYLRQIDYECYDSILGDIAGGFSATLPWNSLIADNCQIGMWMRTKEEIQALAPGVEDNCVVPWVAQPFEKTITLSELNWVNAGISALTPDSGDLSHVQFNTMNNVGVGDYIKIIDYSGSDDHITRITALLSANNYTVDPPVPLDTPSYKAVQFAHYNRKIFSASLAVTAVFSDDGTQAYFSSVADIMEGMTVYFGAIGRRAPIGPRKITTLVGQTATLDRPVSWNAAASGAVTYAAFGASTNNPRPSVPVSFNFPIRPTTAAGDWGATFAIDLDSPASTVSGDENHASNIGGKFTLSLRTGSFKLLLADSTAVDTGQIKHQLGEIDAGFLPLGVDDVLSVDAAVYVEEYDQQWESDPALTGLALPLRNSVLASLRIGACERALA